MGRRRAEVTPAQEAEAICPATGVRAQGRAPWNQSWRNQRTPSEL